LRLWKKAVSVVASAALLASLLTAVTAPAVLGASTSAGGGTIYPGHAPSAPFSLTFAEDAMTQFAASGSFRVAVLDFDGTPGDASWVKTVAPTVTTNLGLGSASAGFDPVTDELVVSVTGNTTTRFDSFTISGLRVTAGPGASRGALIFPYSADTLGLSQTLATATGTTTTAITAGTSTTVTVAVDPWSPPFQVTGTVCDGGAVSAGNATVAASGVVAAEPFAVAGATTPSPQTLTKATPFTGDKPIGTAISQPVCADRFPPPVVVAGDAVLVSRVGATATLRAGVSSQAPAPINAQLGRFSGLLLAGDTVTFTIQTPGVLFSPDPQLAARIRCCGSAQATMTATATRLAIIVRLAADTIAGDHIVFQPNMDVAPTVPNGTPVSVAVTVSRAGVGVLGSPVTVATVIEQRTLSISAVSALGFRPTAGYDARSSKVQVANRWVTWRFSGGDVLANQRVNVLVASRIDGAWGGPRYLRSAWADANGIVTVTLRRPAGTVLNVRIQWPGNAMYRVSTSRALGAHWR
jgi:hypothetical protein